MSRSGRNPYAALARGARQVVRAEHQVRAEESICGVVFVSHTEQRDRGEVRTGGFAGDEQPIGAELFAGVLEQPAGSRLAVVRARGIRVLGCEAIVDAHDRDAALVDDDLVEQIHHLG